MAIQSVSPQEAHDLVSRTDGAVHLDVRTVEEFSAAHPAMAYNVPLLQRDRAGQMVPNPDFLSVVRANFPPDTPLFVACHSGGRSLRAAEILEAAGYTAVVNVRCGFGGARDGSGRIVEPGWAALGLPVESSPRPGASYESLKGKGRP